jgi:predicted acylesterase/phospholipase RssA
MQRRLEPLPRAILAGLVLSLAGCGTLPRNAVPPELMGAAQIPNMPDIRAAAGRPSPVMARDLEQSFAQESEEDFPRAADGLIHYAHLALSGGGSNGAFGAGFLKGWSETSRRPVFKIVTGVSTGALIAPFAFLGPAHDDALREFYTTTTSRDIFIFRVRSLIPQLLGGDALADSRPLAALIARHVDAALLAEVADAHLHGRRLYIGTADLDSQQFIVWNMGKIATSGRPEALDLFRKVMLASASVPIAFPPVLFEVEANGARYDEMHVDGAVATNVFYTGGVFSSSAVRERAGRGGGREEVFVVHNGQLGAIPQATRRTLASIAMRTLDSAAKAATVGDLFRIHTLVAREQAGFRWINIPDGVEIRGDEVFDPARMRELYEVGRQRALEGPPWFTGPPGIWQE